MIKQKKKRHDQRKEEARNAERVININTKSKNSIKATNNPVIVHDIINEINPLLLIPANKNIVKVNIRIAKYPHKKSTSTNSKTFIFSCVNSNPFKLYTGMSQLSSLKKIEKYTRFKTLNIRYITDENIIAAKSFTDFSLLNPTAVALII